LLDEPTNHLDSERILWLEDFIIGQQIPFIVVSHDRKLLDNVCNKTIFLRDGKIEMFSAPFSHAKEELAKLDQAHEHQHMLDKKEVDRIMKASHTIRQFNMGKNAELDRKARILEDKAERLKEKVTEVFRKQRRDLILTESEIRAKTLLRLENINVAAPDGRLLFHIKNLTVKKGDRIVLLGKNGSGKTTLIRMLQEVCQKGEANISVESGITFNPQVKAMFFDQHLCDQPKNESLKDYIRKMSLDLTNEKITHELVAAGFPYKSHTLKIGSLSLGERTRLKFLELKLSMPTFFLLDEPTNHLDIEGIEKLEEELLKTQTAAIIVSHDRALVENVATVFWTIDPKRKTCRTAP